MTFGPAGGYTPADLAVAYDYNPASGGEGQTVAIVDAFDDPNIESDLGGFDSHYGLGACTEANGCFKKVGQTGKSSALPTTDEEGWSVEISLDVEAVRAACQKCKILLVEANSTSFSDLGAAVKEAVKLGATEVSNSYGGPEETLHKLGSTELADYNDPAVPIAVASGDWGWDSWAVINKGEAPPKPPAPNVPSSLPTVVAVGGTTLHMTGEKRSSETVWNGNGAFDTSEFIEGATGGGCSMLYTAPLWQQDLASFPATGCGTKRSAADVSAVADPVTGFDILDTFDCGPDCEEFRRGKEWSTIGGTSLATPLISGMWALAGGASGVEYPARTLYEHLGSSAAFDVSKGGNGFCDDEGKSCGINKEIEEEGAFGYALDCEGTTECNATAGFDGPSGVGAPASLAIFKPPSEEEAKKKAEEEAAKHKAEEEAAARKAEEEAKKKAEEEAARHRAEREAAGKASTGGGPSIGVSPFKAAAPKATLAGVSLKVAPSGAFTIKVSCPAGATNCEGTVTVQSTGAVSARTHVLTLAIGAFKAAGGKMVTVKLRLSAKARKLLARKHSLKVRVSIAAHDSSGQTGSTTTAATLRGVKKHR